jgi:hypothetical protein
MMLLWILLLGQGIYFENATVYDAKQRQMVGGMHISLNGEGTVEKVTGQSFSTPEGTIVVPNALILPHYSDFYSLTQERGLGFDQDVDSVNQAMLMNSYRRGGIFLVRDPMFPPEGIDTFFTQGVSVYAQRGYLDLEGGPAAEFAMVIDPLTPINILMDQLPETGPITLWWSSFGGERSVQWQAHLGFLTRLRDQLHRQGRKLGVYIQDATPAEIQLLENFPVDFVEGMPVDPSKAWQFFGDAIWVPLASLNDKRYCARDLDDRMIDAANRGLYGRKMVSDVRQRLQGIHTEVRERCDIWQRRRRTTLSALTAWITQGGKLAIGSAGGHPYSFSGGIRMEIAVLAEFGAKESDLFKAVFEHTPQLIGPQPAYLKANLPAHFIVYLNQAQQPWHAFVGKRVDYNFTAGQQVVKPR